MLAAEVQISAGVNIFNFTCSMVKNISRRWNMKWLPKQFVLWGTNILQAVAICSSALSIALMMRSSTCLISTVTDTIKRLFFYFQFFEEFEGQNWAGVWKCNRKLSYYKLPLCGYKKKGWERDESDGLTHMWCPSPPASNTSTLHSYSTCSHNPQLQGHRSWKERNLLQTLNVQWGDESI